MCQGYATQPQKYNISQIAGEAYGQDLLLSGP